jgi:hypothetical protein
VFWKLNVSILRWKAGVSDSLVQRLSLSQHYWTNWARNPAPAHFRMETDPVSKTLCSVWETMNNNHKYNTNTNHRICLETPRKYTKSLDSQYPDRDSNLGLPHYKAGLLDIILVIRARDHNRKASSSRQSEKPSQIFFSIEMFII